MTGDPDLRATLPGPHPAGPPPGPVRGPAASPARWGAWGARRPIAGDGSGPMSFVAWPGPAGWLAILSGVACLWADWPTLGEMAGRWSRDPRYSHGPLVPVFSLYLLWVRRGLRPERAGSGWIGLIPLAVAGVLRFLGAYAYVSWLEAMAFLVAVAGLVMLWGGWTTLRWAWPALAFLVFMVPLPYRVETALGSPLQRLATEASAYALQVFGLPAFGSGNTILLGDFRIGVVDACNGLGMSFTFLALSVAVAIMVPRPPMDRMLLIAMAIPIALVLNVARIVATGLLHEFVGPRVADAVYHDLAGWIMLLIGLAILFIECRLLAHLLIPIEDEGADPADRGREPPARPRSAAPQGEGSRAIPVLAGTALIVGSAIVASPWTGRWSDPGERRLAVERLGQIPMMIGDWVGRPERIDSREIRAAELDGSVKRHYANPRTGQTITLVVVCGRPGPVSLHNPNDCYPGAGFDMAQEEPETLAMAIDRPGERAEFARADFERWAAVPSERLRVYWSWKAKGAWSAPSRPRLAFGSQPFLYKLYLIRRVSKGSEPIDDATTRDFLRRVMPVLDDALGSHGDAPASR